MSEHRKARILAFAASARSDSFNKKLVRIALRGCENSGATVTYVDLRDYPLPLYDGDDEAANGLPENVEKLRVFFRECDGLLLASPEYNGFLPPLLKNTLDWLSRSPEAQPDLSAFSGKVAVIMAASPGPLGGLRGLRGVRELLTNLGFTVLPSQITVRSAFKEFDETGEMVDAARAKQVEALGAELAETAAKLLV
ncbi:MAG: NAD(P)H-dependent oxidoreductase [Gammaproteobacteria bacterium]|nr:NAD(P)H-dependent oxidoreductase [Gammaproteobacteria bacterium]